MWQSILLFLKKYWALFAGAAGALLLLAFKSNKADPLPKVIRKSGDKLVDEIEAARQKEAQRILEEEERHKQAVEQIKKKYDGIRGDLNVLQEAEAQRLLEVYKKDPGKLAEELSRLTGAKIILPED